MKLISIFFSEGRSYSPRLCLRNLLHAWCHAIRKRCFTPFKSVCPFLLLCPKEMDERKGHRCAGLVATELSHLLRRIAMSALIWYSASPNGLVVIAVSSNMLLKTADPYPMRHNGANLTQPGGRYVLDREIPLLVFVGRIPRTGSAGCCGRSIRGTFILTSFQILKRLDAGSRTAFVLRGA